MGTGNEYQNGTDAPAPRGDNLRHWSKLSKTDPAFTKPFTRGGGFRGTDINPTWRIMRMTEQFGPVGIGWGMTEPHFDMVQEGAGRVVYCRVGIWYRDGDVKSDIVWGVGGDIVSGKRSSGQAFVDDEAQKKSYTDALGNAMKAIGVSADVFLKQFDDSKYREEVAREFAEKRQDAPAPDPKAIVADMTKALRGAKDRQHLDGLWDAVKKDFGKIGKAEQDAVCAAYDQEAARALVDEFERCASLEALRDLWGSAQGYMHPMTSEQKARVTDAKDVRKRALMAAVPSQAAE